MKYFYLWGQLFVLPFTIYFYLKCDKSVRIKMLVSGLSFGIMALAISYRYLDYWTPAYIIDNIHIEDFSYGFLFAGIITGVSNYFNKTKLIGKYKLNIKLTLLYSIIFFGSFLLLAEYLKINLIYILCIAPLTIGIISLIKIKGKIKDVLLSSFTSLFITVLVYSIIISIYPNAIKDHFILKNISGILLLNIPLEEWLFAICLGVGATNTYEAVFNLKQNKI